MKINIEIEKLTKLFAADQQEIAEQLNAAFPGDGLISRNALFDFLKNYKIKYPDSLSHIPELVFEDSLEKTLKGATERENKNECIKKCLELLLSYLRESEKPSRP